MLEQIRSALEGGWQVEVVQFDRPAEPDGYSQDASGQRYAHWKPGNRLTIQIGAVRTAAFGRPAEEKANGGVVVNVHVPQSDRLSVERLGDELVRRLGRVGV